MVVVKAGGIIRQYFFVLLLTTALAFSSLDAAEITPQVVALSGQPIAGAGGNTFSAVYYPVINNAGQVAYMARLPDGSDWLLAGPPSNPVVVAAPGQAAPGTASTYSSISNRLVQFNDNGTILFSATLADFSTVAMIGPPTSVSPLAQTGQDIPGLAGSSYISFATWLSNSGVSVGALQTGTFAYALLSGQPANLSPAAVQGQSVPGVSPSIQYGPQGSGGPTRSDPHPGISQINAAGVVAFVTPLSGNTGGSNTGLFVYNGSSTTLVARTDPFGDAFFSSPVLNDAGRIALAADSASTGGIGGRYGRIMLGAASGLGTLVSTGDPAPGVAGQTFSGFGPPLIARDGQIVFEAGFGNGQKEGLWQTTPTGGLRLVAYGGEPGTDIPAFNDIISGFEINGVGQVAFLDGSFGGHALWATDPDGNLVKVCAVGDQIDVGGGVLKTVLQVVISEDSMHNTEIPSLTFNDAGQLAFSATFTDGTDGVFVATVPQPNLIPVLAFATPLLLRRRHGIRQPT
jgi:hypothetical protein